MYGDIIPNLNLRQFPVNGKFIIVFTQRPCHIIGVVTGRILLTQHCDMMVRAVHGRAHQVHCAGIHADVLLMGVLLMNHLRHQMPVRSHHEAPQLCIDSHIPHTCGHKYFFIDLADALANHLDIIGLLIRAVRNPDTAGEVNEGDICPHLLLQLHSRLEQRLRQSRIILIGHGIAGKKRVDTKILHTFILQDTEAFKQLLGSKPILRVPRIVHDIVADGEVSARVIAATQSLRQISQCLLQKINMRDVVQVDGSADFLRVGKFLRRRIVGGKHDILPLYSQRMGQHQLCLGGTVAAAAILPQNINQERIGRRLHREKFFVALIPGKSLLQGFRVGADAFLVINMKGSRVLFYNFFNQFLCHECFFFHLSTPHN